MLTVDLRGRGELREIGSNGPARSALAQFPAPLGTVQLQASCTAVPRPGRVQLQASCKLSRVMMEAPAQRSPDDRFPPGARRAAGRRPVRSPGGL
ncbi:hypothetical protein GCM10009760_20490 [Kitasatospora kazusensis]|uniref:Uncharacterized protein n=1 Tax=Kitasatospora kazusensis TaxID=407974 RepID=A0ABP5KXL6_9ACTN